MRQDRREEVELRQASMSPLFLFFLFSLTQEAAQGDLVDNTKDQLDNAS